MKKITFLLLLLLQIIYKVEGQTTVNLNPIKDNTILSDRTSNASGAGRNFIGRVAGEGLRRTLLQFDLSSIPAGSTITGVSLNVNIDMAGSAHSNSIIYSLHRLNRDWGEGTSAGPGGGGGGANAVAPDATWINAITGTPESTWTIQGGDFEANATAASTFTGTNGTQTFSTTTSLVDEVQDWLDGNNPNFGWIIIGGEDAPTSAIRIGSKEIGTAPVLNVTFNTNILSIEDNLPAINDVIIYPNPTSGEVRFNTFKNLNVTADVYDSLGKLISTQKIANNSALRINEPPGLYFVEMVNANGVKRSIKILKK